MIKEKNKKRKHLYWLTAFVLYTAVGFLWTYPLINHMRTGIPFTDDAGPGQETIRLIPQDCLQLYHKYWLFTEVAKGQIPLFSDPYEFAIPGHRGFTSQQIPTSLLYAVLAIIDPVLAYNGIIILSFTLCGLGAMLVAHQYTGRHLASWTGGLIFTLMPFRMAQLMGGHPNGVAVMFLPFMLFLAERAIRKKCRWSGFAAGLCFTSIATQDMQLSYFCSYLLFLYVALRCIFVWTSEPGASREKLIRLLHWAWPMLLGVLPAALYLFHVKFNVLAASAHHGTEAAGWVHKFYPSFNELFTYRVHGETRVYIGYPVIWLSAMGIILTLLCRQMRNRRSHFLLLWSLITLLGIVIGIQIHPLIERVLHHIPLWNLSRTPGRIIVVSFLGLSVLSAYALSSIQCFVRHEGLYRILCIAAALLIGLEYHVRGTIGINLLPRESAVYAYVRDSEPEARVLAVPLWPGDSSWSAGLLYYSTLYRTFFINGYSPAATATYKEDIFKPLQSVNIGHIGSNEYTLCKSLNVSYLTVHPEAFPSPRWVSPYPSRFTVERLKRSPYLDWVMKDDPLELFKFKTAPSEAVIPMRGSTIGLSVHRGHLSDQSIEAIEMEDSIHSTVTRFQPESSATNCTFSGRLMPPGSYRISLRYHLTATRAGQASIIDADRGTVLAEAAIPVVTNDSFAVMHFALHLKQPARLAFRGQCEAGATMLIDIWHVLFQDRLTVQRYEAEDMFCVGSIEAYGHDPEQQVVALDQDDPYQHAILGPYRMYAEGLYRFKARIRIRDFNGVGDALKILFRKRYSPISRNSLELHALVWSPEDGANDEFEILEGVFTVPAQGTVLECSFNKAPHSKADIDWFEIEKVH